MQRRSAERAVNQTLMEQQKTNTCGQPVLLVCRTKKEIL
jgi:hypothetical protein